MKMHRFHLFLLFLLMLFPSGIWAQSEADSLKRILAEAADDTAKVKNMNRLAYMLRSSAPDEALKLTANSRTLAEKLRFDKGISESYSITGVIFYRSGDFSEALKMHFQALRIRDLTGDKRGKGVTYINLGNVYSDLKNTSLAIEYYKNALTIFEELGDRSKKAILYLNIGSVSLEKNDFETGLKYSLLARDEARLVNEPETEALALNNCGVAQIGLGQIEEGYRSHQQAYALSESAGDRNGMVDAAINIGRAFRLQNQFQQAIDWHRKSEKMAIENNYPEGLRFVYEGLSSDYEASGDFKQSLFYLKRFKELSDSLYNIENTERINDLTFHWQKERQDHLLASMQEEIKRRKEEEIKAGTWLWLISGGLLTVLIFAGYMVYAGQKNRQLKRVLSSQQEQILKLNKDLLEKTKS